MSLLTRRKFILKTVVFSGSFYTGLLIKPLRALSATADHLGGLKPAAWKTLSAFADTILPKTSSTPSATEVGVIEYMKNLTETKFLGFKILRFKSPSPEIYKQLVARLDELATKSFKEPFSDLTAEQTLQVVQVLSRTTLAQVGYRIAGVGTKTHYEDSDLYALVRANILEGYFSLPDYGGNKDFKSWEAINYVCNFNYPKSQSSCPPHTI